MARNWTHATNWGSTAPLGEWYGVSTNSGGRVTELILENNNLRGPLPTGLVQLNNLSNLNLSGKSVDGRDSLGTGPAHQALGLEPFREPIDG